MTDAIRPPWHARVLVVSDSVADGTREDRGGVVLRDALEAAGAAVDGVSVCPDGVPAVVEALRSLTSGYHGLVITTGGTGFGPRDLTPEATREVIDREAPGLAEAMRLVNPLGRLSRGIVGIRGQAIIVNTPGSPKGCVEQLTAILDVLPHALRLLADTPTSH